MEQTETGSNPTASDGASNHLVDQGTGELASLQPGGDGLTENPDPAVEFEVFLSFRGPDTRSELAEFLHWFLTTKGITTFIDDESLRTGEVISDSLTKAIRESRIYIPIFSPGYASSKWCLMELALMVKHLKEDEARHTIIPIFYEMDPTHVRNCTGPYEEGMEELIKDLDKKAKEQKGPKYDEGTIKSWKEALTTAGEIKGLHSKSTDRQRTLAEKVYSRVWPLVHEKFSLVKDELIGIDFHVDEVMKKLNSQTGINIVGILGMGGMGKTTIAKAVHDKLGTQFDRRCFLEDVREIQSSKTESEAINILQSKIIHSTLGEYHELKAGDGINIIEKRVRSKKVLIIFDDVDEKFELKKILGEVSKFSSESRFIITTRNERVLELLGVTRLHIPEKMSDAHSLELFRCYALRGKEPLMDSEDCEVLCRQFVKIAKGVPLTLRVIGSLLYCTGIEFWTANLKKLEKMLHPDVHKILKLSYDTLEPEEKEIFLDIACAFIGRDKEYPSYMWEDRKLYPGIGIQILIWRSLIKVDEDNKFRMHDHLRDIGRTIARNGDDEHSGKPTRIWSNKDALDMLRNGKGTDKLQVLSVDGLRTDLTEKEFQKLSGLRYLEVRNVRWFLGNFKKILPDLCWLCLDNCDSIPIDFNFEKLVILELKKCRVYDKWRCWDRHPKKEEGQRLKVIDVSSCDFVKKVPNLVGCTSLEMINFRNCSGLEGEFHIGHLKGLRVLNLAKTPITKLIGNMGMLRKLQEINVAGSRLGELPAKISKVSSLKILDLGRLKIEVAKLPTNLQRLTLSSSTVSNLLELKDLEKLWLNCDILEVPGDMRNLSKLKDLTLHQVGCGCGPNALVIHQESVDSQSQERGERTPISSSPTLPSSLNTLLIQACEHVERLPNLENLTNLTSLTLLDIGAHKIAGLGKLRMLEIFHLRNASNLRRLGGLEHMELLKDLQVSGCPVLGTLPSLSNLTKLQKLIVIDCPLVYEIQGLGELAELSTLTVKGCSGVTRVIGLDKSESLQVIEITDCESIEELSDLSALMLLRELTITGCTRLTQVTGIEGLESLRTLVVTSIRILPDLSALKHLQKLGIAGCNQLTEVMGLDKLESLRVLEITDCASLKKLPDLSDFECLWKLKITRCNQLTEVMGHDELESLDSLTVSDCSLIKKLHVLSSESEREWVVLVRVRRANKWDNNFTARIGRSLESPLYTDVVKRLRKLKEVEITYKKVVNHW